MYYLLKDLYFPPVEQADKFGLLAFGGDLLPERLMLAYRSGIFPWFQEDEPILWWSPPKRMVLFFNELKVSKSMRNIINRGMFKVTFDQDFEAVIRNCSSITREGQEGTWINEDMINAYLKLHELGFAKSVEVWQDGILVGGLYGVDLGHVFCGESMFSKVSNASKMAFIALSRSLQAKGYALLDCQLHNDYLESLGCREIARNEFMQIVGSK